MTAICAGVLALQGSVEPHLRALSRAGVDPIELRRPDQLDQITHLVLPGGESTTLHHLLELHSLSSEIPQRVEAGDLALLGTCAGAILMGRECQESPPRWNLIDVEFQRNGYGRQVHSFIEPIEWIAGPGPGASEGIFIRAPRIGQLSPPVEVIATLGTEAVAVRQERCVACTFHPELTEDDRLHRWFLSL
ncbi:MAG: pyridoxal 5'-phosphate synthase glutaminase subunit PdxT [Planctomycetota bacterium]|nr:pyridoxal 5'-phosphate synthase glutaminase subunit PdxT [Planctomycetota bacterium]MDE0961104.1 pyridoxal 5'-phosphate synthase glutaminase subunit PdxT [Planctomycetota bacterium]